VAYLQKTQAEHGLWDEARFTATGFPRVFYLRYHGYGKFFPLWALARYRNLLRANDRRVGVGFRTVPGQIESRGFPNQPNSDS